MRSGSDPQQQMRLAGPPHFMRQPPAAFLPIIVALILLPAIAFASPPDPSWIAGIYDGADGDDIVSLVYETAAAHAAERLYIGPLPWLADITLQNIVRGICDGRSLAALGRPLFEVLWSTLMSSASCRIARLLPQAQPLQSHASLTPHHTSCWQEPQFLHWGDPDKR